MSRATQDLLMGGGPPLPVRPIASTRERLSRRRMLDRLSARFVTLGGLLIIASILAILVVIVAETAPLFRAPSAVSLGTIRAPVGSAPFTVGVDEHRQIAYLVTATGVQFVGLTDGAGVGSPLLPGRNGARVTSASAFSRGQFVIGLSDGRVIPVEVRFDVTFPEGRRRVDATLHAKPPMPVGAGDRPIRHVAYAVTEKGPVLVAATGPADVTFVTVKETKPLVGPSTREELRRTLSMPIEGEITALVADERGDQAFVASSSGQVVRVDLRSSEPRIAGTISTGSQPGVGVTAMAFLLGDRTLVIGDAAGAVSSWLLLPDEEPAGLKKVHSFASHAGAVVALAPSRRNKGFLSADATGTVRLHYATTGRTLLAATGSGGSLNAVAFAPKADGLLTLDASGQIGHWEVRNPHPQITLQSLFGKTWYEGYKEPAYVWQSTGGTDDFEEKFSLIPLIYGTLKGTFYAMLVALPLALLGAIYASQFMHPTLKGMIKPVVEIMAALPSVVLGFLAGLWLAPMIERVVPGVFLMVILAPASILGALAAWRLVPKGVRARLRPGTEVFLLIPIMVGATWLALRLGAVLEGALLAGDYRGWLLSTLGLTYDQRNSLVVGFAMGFAVIPIIFTIAEDALSNVPPYLTAGSLALGATRWQTAIRVVLPTASPGIFSALMIGFGRAVGETMIVLMATGNTPIMDWSIFNGFRALSANIAVELPEAPQAGTLYRVLFLAAFLLFVMTFIVNTAAEIVRLRLRKRYQAL